MILTQHASLPPAGIPAHICVFRIMWGLFCDRNESWHLAFSHISTEAFCSILDRTPISWFSSVHPQPYTVAVKSSNFRRILLILLVSVFTQIGWMWALNTIRCDNSKSAVWWFRHGNIRNIICEILNVCEIYPKCILPISLSGFSHMYSGWTIIELKATSCGPSVLGEPFW